MVRHSLAITALTAVAVLASGCTITFEGIGGGSSRGETQGGIYKTVDLGGTWLQRSAIAAANGAGPQFNRSGIAAIAFDPQDREALYAGTIGGGLVYSYDGGASWQIARDLGQRTVRTIVVSAADQCTVFAAAENKIFKTTNCSRDWKQMYFDNETDITINTLAIHPQNSAIIYAGNSRGEVLISNDGGVSWAVRQRFSELNRSGNSAILKLIINERNPATIWAATVSSGVHVTRDGGASWRNYVEEFMEIHTRDALQVTDIALAQADGATVIVATKAGLIRTLNDGELWQVMELIPPADETAINAVAMYAGDKSRIYYATDTSFGYTVDGGTTWTSQNLPSPRGVQTMAVDFTDPNVVYLGMRRLPE